MIVLLVNGFNIVEFENRYDYDRRNACQAFIPGNSADTLEPKIVVGKVCIIRKFTVQKYKLKDKFICLKNKVQLIFSNETQIKDSEDDGKSIQLNTFDFYDNNELKELTKHTQEVLPKKSCKSKCF